jgi:hypothetical protein
MTESQSHIQEFERGGHWYRLVVGIDVTHPEWKAIVLKDGKRIHEEDYNSEQQAKRLAHFLAFADSGAHDHDCNGDCQAWVRNL